MKVKPLIYQFDDVRVDLDIFRVFKAGIPVQLEPKAFEVLVFLVEHRGRLIEKKELLDAVWNEAFVTQGAMTRVIGQLRKALGDDSKQARYIETVPTRGYRFIAEVEVKEAKALPVESFHAEASPARQVDHVAANQVAAAHATSNTKYLAGKIKRQQHSFAIALMVLLPAAIGVGYWFFAHRAANTPQIDSIAVLPFQNASGNADVEYLSDGIAESLINSLSQLSHLTVKARSSVFRYRGKEVEPQQVASELTVQAILNGRMVQRGDDLTLYLSLVDGRNGNQLWGKQYNRKLADLVFLQSEIARDVLQELRLRLSGADEQKLAKNYTANAEANQLYLKGRYHLLKLTQPEIQTGNSYFQQAIAIDPSYALAYVGVAEVYRALVLAGGMPPAEFFPKAKAAAQKAIEIDDSLADAHASLGFIMFWYDWNWNKAENELKRALDLNPNNADTHIFYAHLLSNTGRHMEALAEAKRARELDPLNLRSRALEGGFLIHAGRFDEAIAMLQETFDLDPNYWFTHQTNSSAYIEKGMFAKAVAEARKAIEVNRLNTFAPAFLGYALAKLGKKEEARAELDELLKRSNQGYVPPSNIAMIYNGLGEHDEALVWLERGYEQRDALLVFLKVERKWDSLRADPRFQDLLRRVGFTP